LVYIIYLHTKRKMFPMLSYWLALNVFCVLFPYRPYL